MSLLSDLVRRTTGMGVGSNLGRIVGSAFGGTTGAIVGQSVGGELSAELSRQTKATQQGQAVAISQATQTLPQETQQSGSEGRSAMSNGFQQAVYNVPMPPQSTQQSGFQQASILPFVMGAGSLAAGVGAVIDLFYNDPITGETKRKKITRKFKSQVKQSVELVGLEETARMLNTEPEIVVQILLKRFRNDGPYITKAAVRKTRATVRKMEQVNMLSKEIAKLAGTSTTRRRATTGTRASTSRKTTVIQ